MVPTAEIIVEASNEISNKGNVIVETVGPATATRTGGTRIKAGVEAADQGIVAGGDGKSILANSVRGSWKLPGLLVAQAFGGDHHIVVSVGRLYPIVGEHFRRVSPPSVKGQ